MPLFIPVLIGVAVVGATGLGAKKGYDGVSHIARARGVIKKAEERYDRSVHRLETAREATQARAIEFGHAKGVALRGSIESFLNMLRALERRGKIADVSVIEGIELTDDDLQDFQTSVVEARRIASGGLVAGAAGIAASQSAVALVGSYGAASTGTAIAGLSGAAAQNATLAWLGGGAISAGGWGMAGGTVVLGGIAVAPIFAIGGFTLATQGAKALTQAEEYQSRVNEAVHEMGSLKGVLTRVRRRMDELQSIVEALDRCALAAMEQIDIDAFDLESDDDIGQFQAVASLVKSLGEVLRVPVIDEEGQVSSSSGRVIKAHRRILEST